jgi:hypothetical protein
MSRKGKHTLRHFGYMLFFRFYRVKAPVAKGFHSYNRRNRKKLSIINYQL